jgi:heptaprenyl diphosphate synthase
VSLAAVDALMLRTLADRDPMVEAVNTHLARAGGKRLRATIVLLASAYGRPERAPAAIAVAAGVELIHLASLIHDDGRPAVHRAWGVAHAAFSGACLLSRAAELIADAGDEAVRRALSRTVTAVCRGQLAETAGRGAGETTPAEYRRIVHDKTGRMFAFAAYAGATAAQAGPAIAARLRRFGARFGLLLQLVDDLHDALDARAEGKPTGTDVRQGVFSAPVVFACLGESPEAVALRALLREPPLEGERLARALTLVRRGPAIDATRRAAASAAAEAAAALADLPPSDAASRLRMLVHERLAAANPIAELPR